MTAPAWTVAAAYAVPVLILAGCAAYRRRRRHVPGLPARGRISLTDEEVMEKYLGILLNLHEIADEPERSP